MIARDATVLGVDPGAPAGDLSAIDIRLLLAQPIPNGDIAILHQICTERAGQIHQRGHSPQADAELPPMVLPCRARRYLNDGIEYLSLNRIDVAIPKLIKAGALIIAAIARIRLEQRDQQS